jgi:uncharacterized protein (TIGR02145 family)
VVKIFTGDNGMKCVKGLGFLWVAVLAAFFALSACDDSSSASDDNNEISAVESSSSTSTDKEKSSDSKTKQSSSSSEEQNSSSTEKMSSSSQKTGMNDKSSSSVNGGGASSSSFVTNCKVVCSEECEGVTKWRDITTQVICREGVWLNIDSLEALSSSSYFDTTKVFNPNVEYGSHTDSRDGKVYRTIEINNGFIPFTFFAENLNYGKMIEAGKNQSDSTKYCYNNDSWYCEHGFGGLYTWSNAMGFPSACDSVSVGSDKCPGDFTYPLSGNSDSALYVYHQGVCDEGWHIMNAGEWGEITKFSKSLAAVITSEIWVPGRENRYGVSLLPASKWSSKDGFAPINKQYEMSTSFWYPWQGDYNWAHGPTVYTSQDNTGKLNGILKTNAVSVRCVKDYNIFDYVTWLSQE